MMEKIVFSPSTSLLRSRYRSLTQDKRDSVEEQDFHMISVELLYQWLGKMPIK